MVRHPRDGRAHRCRDGISIFKKWSQRLRQGFTVPLVTYRRGKGRITTRQVPGTYLREFFQWLWLRKPAVLSRSLFVDSGSPADFRIFGIRHMEIVRHSPHRAGFFVHLFLFSIYHPGLAVRGDGNNSADAQPVLLG